ncbi:hypothetical protein E2C01_072470 [Portunus trituberculatus]|uniref:Uncharacterized protein n=1 Tax=Portunus trituberculatus TaxID=210409 RepID=A0A5B7I7X1_PORTR|nr:hypothetical protein [Portunus trituberculatus]
MWKWIGGEMEKVEERLGQRVEEKVEQWEWRYRGEMERYMERLVEVWQRSGEGGGSMAEEWRD